MLRRQWVRNLIPVPFWASLSANVGWVCMTTPRRTFTDVTRSHLLGGIATSGSRLPPFLPCTSTLDNQSHAVGRCCLLTTSGVGVTPTWMFSCQSTVALCRSASILAYSFERTGRTTALQPTRVPLRSTRAAERDRWATFLTHILCLIMKAHNIHRLHFCMMF